jgi:predicted enzyme related to lactoylglutathione lyase
MHADAVSPRRGSTKTFERLDGGTTMRLLAWTAALLALSFGGMQAAKKAPHPDVGAGRVGWFDITTRKPAEARDFYMKLFDWKIEPLSKTNLTSEIISGDKAIGSFRVAEGNISSFNGVVYVQVNDMTASCKKATELGGKIPEGFPFNLSDGAGAIALVYDPCGHPVGMYSRTSMPEKTPTGK